MKSLKKDKIFIWALVALVALAIVFFLTPVNSWLTRSSEAPAAEPSVSPSSTIPAIPTSTVASIVPTVSVSPPPPPMTSSTATPTAIPPSSAKPAADPKTVVYANKEVQEMLDQIATFANSSSKAKVEYMKGTLEQDQLLLSAKGEAMGVTGEVENLVVQCEGRTVTFTGIVKAWTYEPKMELVIDITTEGGKPTVTITKFRLGGVTVLLNLMGLSRDKMQAVLNDIIITQGWKMPYDLESLTIAGGQLIVKYK